MMKLGTYTMTCQANAAAVRLNAMTSSDLGTYVEGEIIEAPEGSFEAGDQVELTGGAQAIIVKLAQEVDVIEVTQGGYPGGPPPDTWRKFRPGAKRTYLQLRMLG